MGIRPLIRILLGWFSAMVAENIAGLGLLVLYALAAGGPQRLSEITRGGEQQLGGDTLVFLTAAAAPAVWGWVWFYRRRVDQGSIRALGLGGEGRALKVLVGWLCGLAAPGLILAVGLLSGEYLWGAGASPPPGSAAGTPAGASAGSLPVIFLLLLAFLIQGSAEELLERGYLQRSLWEWRVGDPHRAAWALVLPSVIFSLFHLANPGFGPVPFVNTVLIGVFLACLTLSSGSLWWAIGVHGGWNFGLSVLWSLPVSGVQTAHLLPLHAARATSIYFGGEYGPEGGLVVTFLVVALLSWVLPRAWEVREGEDREMPGTPSP